MASEVTEAEPPEDLQLQLQQFFARTLCPAISSCAAQVVRKPNHVGLVLTALARAKVLGSVGQDVMEQVAQALVKESRNKDRGGWRGGSHWSHGLLGLLGVVFLIRNC